MYDVQKDDFIIGVSATQVSNVAKNIHYFLAWILFACFYNQVLYYIYFQKLSHYYNFWFLGFGSTIFFLFCLTLYFQHAKKLSTFYLDLCCQLVCILIGAGLALGVYLINQSLPLENPLFKQEHLIVFTGLLLSISYITGMVYLAQRLRYFLYVFIPSAFLIFFSKLLFIHHMSEIYNFIFNVWFSIMLISAFLTYKTYKYLNLLNTQNKFYLKQSKQHLEECSALHTRLESEILKSKNIEQELQLSNQLLEKKVEERTHDINHSHERLRHHQANLDFAYETAGIHSWVWNIEKRNTELSVHESKSTLRQPENKLQTVNIQIHPDDQVLYRDLMRRHLRGFSDRFEANYRVMHHHQWRWIKNIGKVIARDPQTNIPLRMVGIHQDIEQEKLDQEKLKLASIVFNQVAQGVFVLDKNFYFIDVNPFLSELLNIPREQMISKHMFDITINKHFKIRQIHAQMTQTLLSTGSYQAEIHDDFISGKSLILWVHINAVYDDKNDLINYVGAITDLTEHRRREQRLAYLENYNLLTDLPNRVYFNLQMHQYLINKNKPLIHFAVLRLNIDRFRNFNKFLTHQAGDELLKKMSSRLKNVCSDALLIAYLNSDDFAIIYNLSNSKTPIQQTIDKIITVCNRPFKIFEQDHEVTVSLGVAIYPEHGRQIGSLNSHAESALIEAKRLGGNTVYYYENKSNPLIIFDLQLEIDLKSAVKNNELEVHYQAKINSRTMRTIGFEALIRWNHPKHGVIMPDRFLPIAEESSLISEIGEFVFFEACKQIHQWQNQGLINIGVSINIVAQQIHRGLLITQIDQALAKYNLDPQLIELELTESSLLDKSETVTELLKDIKDRNIKISLDDFGTGYSSLAYLADYPIDILKIDRSFITKIGSKKDNAIVNAIIAMGKAMEMQIVAEGVETLEQIQYLQQQGCDFFQGYYFSRPLNAKESTQFLIKEKLIK